MSKPRLALLTIVSTLAYLALPILGWGGIAPFFANPARIALTLVLFVFALAALFTQGNLSTGVREDRSNRWVLAAFGVLGLLAGWLPPIWTALMSGPSTVTPCAGSASCCSPSAARRGSGRSSCSATASAAWWRSSPGIGWSPGASMASSAIPAISVSSSARSAGRSPSAPSPGWCWPVLMIVPIIGRIRAEEALLRSEFGTEYDAYRARTSRLIPAFDEAGHRGLLSALL